MLVLKVRWLAKLLAVGVLLSTQLSLAEAVHNPRVAIIMSKASFDRAWDVSQMSAHGWVGIANLAGIPYDTVFLEDLIQEKSASRYRVLVFAQCTTVGTETSTQLLRFLQSYLQSGGNVVVCFRVLRVEAKGFASCADAFLILFSTIVEK